MSDDRLEIRGLRAFGRHGVFPEERATGQEFVVDAALTLDATAAATTDALADTVDYAELAGRLHAIVEGRPVALIETLAERLAAACLTDARVRAVVLTVHKPSAPVGVPVDDIAVTIRRTRG